MENVNQHRLVLVKGRKDKKICQKKSKKSEIVPTKLKKWHKLKKKTQIVSGKSVLNGHRTVPVNTTLYIYTLHKKANLAKRELEESLSLSQSKEKERFQKPKK